MTAIGVLKSLKPEGWPDRINVGRAVARFPNGTESGSWYSRPQDDDKTAEYALINPAVLAALPEVRALVEAETKRCAKIADDHTPAKHTAALASHVTGRTIAAAIRAKGGEA